MCCKQSCSKIIFRAWDNVTTVESTRKVTSLYLKSILSYSDIRPKTLYHGNLLTYCCWEKLNHSSAQLAQVSFNQAISQVCSIKKFKNTCKGMTLFTSHLGSYLRLKLQMEQLVHKEINSTLPLDKLFLVKKSKEPRPKEYDALWYFVCA